MNIAHYIRSYIHTSKSFMILELMKKGIEIAACDYNICHGGHASKSHMK